MNLRERLLAQALVAVVLGAVGQAVGSACSTIAEPTEDGPPVCEFCDVGERELRCSVFTYIDGAYHGTISDSAYVCLSLDATNEEKEHACLDSCEEYIADDPLELLCGFEDGVEPFVWSNCVPPEAGTGGGAGGGYECPGWYAPAKYISEPESSPMGLTITVERTFIEEIQADPVALLVCDDARYVEYDDAWVFERVEPGDLLYRLGIREGDHGAMAQGFDPQTMMSTTDSFVLDSVERLWAAYEGLRDADGVKITVERPGTDGSQSIWISIK